MRAVIETTRDGVPERYTFAEMNFVNADAGGSFQPMFGWISGPFDDIPHRIEQPTFRSHKTGDILVLEIEGRWGGYIAQIDRTFSIGLAHSEMRDGIKLAWESFDRVFESLRPGVTVGELIDAGRVTGMNGRGRASLTTHGCGTGQDGPGVFGTPPPKIGNVVVDESCCFIVKPSVQVEGRLGYWGWSESVVVRSHGAKRLGTRPHELYELI